MIVQLSFKTLGLGKTQRCETLTFVIYRALLLSMLPSSAQNSCVDWSEGFPNMVV